LSSGKIIKDFSVKKFIENREKYLNKKFVILIIKKRFVKWLRKKQQKKLRRKEGKY